MFCVHFRRIEKNILLLLGELGQLVDGTVQGDYIFGIFNTQERVLKYTAKIAHLTVSPWEFYQFLFHVFLKFCF